MGIYCLYTYNAYFYFNSNKRSQILAYHPNILETLRRSVLELTNYICKYANKCNLSTEFCWIETKQLHLHKLIITLLNLIALNMQVKTYKHGNTTFIS